VIHRCFVPNRIPSDALRLNSGGASARSVGFQPQGKAES
jgi:hypothetical protein